MIVNLKCRLISGICDQAAGDPFDTYGSKKVCCMHANNHMQSSTQSRKLLLRFFLLIEPFEECVMYL